MEKSTPFKGYFQIDKYQLRHRKFDGGMTPVISREIFERGHAAGALLYDPDRDEVVLVEQFRTGAFAAGVEPWMVEVIAGIIEDGELPEAVARREAREEAGLEITELQPIGRFMVTPGGSSESLYLYCGKIDSEGAGGLHGLTEEGEDIRVLVMSAEEALARLTAGEFVNLNAIVSLQWLALNREKLQQRWRS